MIIVKLFSIEYFKTWFWKPSLKNEQSMTILKIEFALLLKKICNVKTSYIGVKWFLKNSPQNCFLHFCRRYLIILQKIDSEMDDFKRRLCAQTSNYTSFKHFFKSQINPKIFSAILHSQFNYHTLLVTPFKDVFVLLG